MVAAAAGRSGTQKQVDSWPQQQHSTLLDTLPSLEECQGDTKSRIERQEGAKDGEANGRVGEGRREKKWLRRRATALSRQPTPGALLLLNSVVAAGAHFLPDGALSGRQCEGGNRTGGVEQALSSTVPYERGGPERERTREGRCAAERSEWRVRHRSCSMHAPSPWNR